MFFRITNFEFGGDRNNKVLHQNFNFWQYQNNWLISLLGFELELGDALCVSKHYANDGMMMNREGENEGEAPCVITLILRAEKFI